MSWKGQAAFPQQTLTINFVNVLPISRYSLMEKGQPLAARCSEFDYAVQNLTQAASVPTIPVMAARFVS